MLGRWSFWGFQCAGEKRNFMFILSCGPWSKMQASTVCQVAPGRQSYIVQSYFDKNYGGGFFVGMAIMHLTKVAYYVG